MSVDGDTHQMEGRSWLDRQWEPVAPQPDTRWSWISFNMPNGDAVAIWDAVSETADSSSWVTAMHADGSYEIAAVEPFAEGASAFWTSSETGQTYPTRWQVNIPALDTHLTVDVTGNDEQESSSTECRMEATAAFTGTYHGVEVSGKSYVEMFGDWR